MLLLHCGSTKCSKFLRGLCSDSCQQPATRGAAAAGGIFPSPKSGDGGGLTVVSGPFSNFAAAKKCSVQRFWLRDAEMPSRCPLGKSTPPGEPAPTSALPPNAEESQWCQVLPFSAKFGSEYCIHSVAGREAPRAGIGRGDRRLNAKAKDHAEDRLRAPWSLWRADVGIQVWRRSVEDLMFSAPLWASPRADRPRYGRMRCVQSCRRHATTLLRRQQGGGQLGRAVLAKATLP